jgi:hypothetical protein
MIPLYSFSERRRGMKYERKRHFDKNEPMTYTPTFQTETKREEWSEILGSTERVVDKFSFHPHTYWLTFGKGQERPFTGEHWDKKDLGTYECKVCQTPLFL